MRNFQVDFFWTGSRDEGWKVWALGSSAALSSHTARASSRDPGSSAGLPRRLGNLTSHPLRCQQAEALLQCSHVVTETPFFSDGVEMAGTVGPRQVGGEGPALQCPWEGGSGWACPGRL